MNYKILIIALSLTFIMSGCTKNTVESLHNQTIATFDDHSTVRILNDLIQLDIDTYHVYKKAAKDVKDPSVKKLLQDFASDHEDHVTNLSKLVLDLKGHPPSFSQDFKGFVTEGYTAIKVTGGKLKILEAMETNEIISNRYYNKALSCSIPRAIKEVVQRNLDGEKQHLTIIRTMIERQ